MKLLLIGRVIAELGDQFSVTLFCTATTQELESRIAAHKLQAIGAGVGDEFSVSLTDDGVRMERMESKQVSEEKLAAIRQSFKGRWKF